MLLASKELQVQKSRRGFVCSSAQQRVHRKAAAAVSGVRLAQVKAGFGCAADLQRVRP